MLDIKTRILPILRKYEISEALLVGSYARGEENENSDIDIVITIAKPISLLTFARIKIELEDALHRKVDLIEKSALKPELRKHILSDQLSLI